METTESEIVRCPGCGQANRVPREASGKRVVCGRCRKDLAAPAGGAPLVLGDADFDAAASAARAMVVDFWAPWCGPCRIIAPAIESLARDRKDVTFAKVNVDENPALARRFGIQGIPTLVFLERGTEKDRLVGAVGEASIRQKLEATFR